MLKFKLETDQYEGLDDNVKPHYEKGEDGKSYYLDVEGAVSKTKLDEFRNNNVELKRSLSKFDGIDLNEVSELKKFKQDHKDSKLMDAGKLDSIIGEPTSNMKGEYEGKISELEKNLNLTSTRLETLLIDGDIRAAATGIRETAIDDVLLRARQTFKLHEGTATPFDQDGNIIYGKDGTNPMSTTEWMKGLEKSAPHLFKESSGGGARRNPGYGGGDTSNMSTLQKITAGVS